MGPTYVSIGNFQEMIAAEAFVVIIVGIFVGYWVLRYLRIISELSKIVGDEKSMAIIRGSRFLGLTKR
jgi:hypothetical protein